MKDQASVQRFVKDRFEVALRVLVAQQGADGLELLLESRARGESEPKALRSDRLKPVGDSLADRLKGEKIITNSPQGTAAAQAPKMAPERRTLSR